MTSPSSDVSINPGMARPETVDEDEEQIYEAAGDSVSSEEIMESSEDDETSSAGSSTDEEDSIEQDTDRNSPTITSVPSHPRSSATSQTDLRSRLASFLPQLQQANAKLETDPDAASRQIDHVDDAEEQYIEMNLGLGVLRAKPGSEDAGVKTTVSEDSESSGDASDDTASVSEDHVGAGNIQVGIVDKLKGVKPAKRKIEEVA
jgi:hypothetical protein